MEIHGVMRQEFWEYLNLKVVLFAKVASQVVCQVSSSNDVPTAMAWYDDFDHRGLFAERSVRRRGK